MRYGPDPDAAYQRLSGRHRSRQATLVRMTTAQLVDIITGVLLAERGAGRWHAPTGIPAMAYVMAMAIRHSAYHAGIDGLAGKFASSPSTIKRASRIARPVSDDGSNPEGLGLVWRTRGRTGEHVTIWRPSTELIDRVWSVVIAKRAVAREAKRERKAKRHNNNSGVNSRHVAPPLRAGQNDALPPAVDNSLPEPDKPDIEDAQARADHARESGMAAIRAHLAQAKARHVAV